MVEPEGPQIIWRMRVACWISKATRAQAHARARAPTHIHTRMHSPTRAHAQKYVTPLFHGNSGFVNAPHCYVIRTLHVLLLIGFVTLLR